MEHVQTGGEPHVIGKTVEVEGQRKDGSEFPLELSLAEWQVADEHFYTGIIQDITQRKQAEEDLHCAKEKLEAANLELQQSLEREKLLARTDGLTDLYNHRFLFELATREFHAAVRYQRPLTFLMFDLDGFKQVNDTLGHSAGDKLLVRVAQTTVAQVRASDVVARYGGDEFVVMLPNASAQQALPVAERIRASVEALQVNKHHNDKNPLTITLSIGIAEIRHDPAESVERVIQRADKALYKAKLDGRNRIVIYGQDTTGAT
jgi:diguanylate cyclase (GGDEF)-like protein